MGCPVGACFLVVEYKIVLNHKKYWIFKTVDHSFSCVFSCLVLVGKISYRVKHYSVTQWMRKIQDL